MAGRCLYDRMQTHVAQSGGVRGYNRTNHQSVPEDKLQEGKFDRGKDRSVYRSIAIFRLAGLHTSRSLGSVRIPQRAEHVTCPRLPHHHERRQL
jgi:hypothetical protein